LAAAPEFENGLLRCELVLAGANHRATKATARDDGIVTGLEILGVDLRGTQIVVLSACQTAEGTLAAGEGATRPQQVFQLPEREA